MFRSIGKQSGSPWSQSWRRKGTHCRDQLLHSSRSDDMQAEGRHKIAPNYHGMRSGPTSYTSFLESTRRDTVSPSRNGILIGPSVFAGITCVPDAHRQ